MEEEAMGTAQGMKYGDRNYNKPLAIDRNVSSLTASKQGSIPRAYSDLGLNLETVHKCVDDLEQRLGTVLRPEYPVADAGGKAQEVPPCSLAEAIQSDANRLLYVSERLQSILSRIEL